jgi:P27 family predicted phage terminase small subunit
MPRRGSKSIKKAPGTAADPRNGQKAALSVVPGERNPQKFEPPRVVGAEALRQWNDFWDDPVSWLITPADRMLLVKWVELVDRYFSLMRLADKEPITRGSTHNDVVNPLYGMALKMQAEIKAIEAQLGIGPKNRAALGIAVLSERRSLQDLNQEYDAGEADDVDDEDPRIGLTIVPGEAER